MIRSNRFCKLQECPPIRPLPHSKWIASGAYTEPEILCMKGTVTLQMLAALGFPSMSLKHGSLSKPPNASRFGWMLALRGSERPSRAAMVPSDAHTSNDLHRFRAGCLFAQRPRDKDGRLPEVLPQVSPHVAAFASKMFQASRRTVNRRT